MNRNKFKYIAGGLGLLLLLLLLEYGPQREHDWSASYLSDAKSPLGAYLTYRHSELVFSEMFHSDFSIYETVNTLPADPSEKPVYFIVNDAFYPDEASLSALTSFIAGGGTAFVSAYDYSSPFLNQLNVSLSCRLPVPMELTVTQEFAFNPITFKLNLPEPYEAQKVHYKTGLFRCHFSGLSGKKNIIDTPGSEEHTRETGQGEDDNDNLKESQVSIHGRDGQYNPVLISLEHGKGRVFLHSQPRIFSNYFMRNPEHAQHVYDIFGFLPEDKLLWDNHYKAGRLTRQVDNQLSFILSQPALASAYFLLIGVILLTAVLGIKRRQRAIPEYHPPVNTTLDFVRTIGSLFYEQKDHALMGRKKLMFFRQNLNEQHGIPPAQFKEAGSELVRKLTIISGMEENRVHELVQVISTLQQKSHWTKKDLISLDETLYLFTQNIKKHGKYRTRTQ